MLGSSIREIFRQGVEIVRVGAWLAPGYRDVAARGVRREYRRGSSQVGNLGYHRALVCRVSRRGGFHCRRTVFRPHPVERESFSLVPYRPCPVLRLHQSNSCVVYSNPLADSNSDQHGVAALDPSNHERGLVFGDAAYVLLSVARQIVSQFLSMVVNEKENDWHVQLLHVESA